MTNETTTPDKTRHNATIANAALVVLAVAAVYIATNTHNGFLRSVAWFGYGACCLIVGWLRGRFNRA